MAIVKGFIVLRDFRGLQYSLQPETQKAEFSGYVYDVSCKAKANCSLAIIKLLVNKHIY